MDSQAKIIQMSIVSPVQTLIGLSQIVNWLGGTEAYIKKWYDQTGNGLHLINQGTLSTFRLVSDKGDFPAIYITGGTTNYLKVVTANTVTNLAIAVFADFTFRTGASNTPCGFFGYIKYYDGGLASSFIKNEGGYSLIVRNIGTGYSPQIISSGNIEGRLAGGFSIAPNDIRVYVGNKVVS